MRSPPCKSDCPDRTETCHDTCVRYTAWKHERILETRAMKNDRHMHSTVMDLHAGSVRRALKGKKRWKN